MPITEMLSTWKNRLLEKTISVLASFLPAPRFDDLAWCVAEFETQVYSPLPDGRPDYSKPIKELWSKGHNLVTDVGRQKVLKFVLGINSPAAPVSFPYLGVGSGTTAADAGDTELETELEGNATRKTLLNTSDLALSDSDIAAEVSGAFLWKVVAQATFLSGDANNGSTFAEYGLFTTNTYATDVMYNRYVHPSPFVKSAALSVVVRVTLRA